MSPKPRPCQNSQVEHVRKFVAFSKKILNDAGYYPPRSDYKTMVALALYSKCLTVAEATLLLVDADFGDEAFGMTRTLVDIFFSLHYIANKDSDERARKFYRFLAKDIEGWSEVIKQFWPHNIHNVPAHVQRTAATYRHPHRWSGRTVADLALEPDTVEIDPSNGKPTVHDFDISGCFDGLQHLLAPY